MIFFACDWCKVIKDPGETWVLGMAAESVGVTAVRREVEILAYWDETQAVHPLAVHFCCLEHKNNYMEVLFEPEDAAAETVVERTVKSPGTRAAERKVVRQPRSKPNLKSNPRSSGKRRQAA